MTESNEVALSRCPVVCLSSAKTHAPHTTDGQILAFFWPSVVCSAEVSKSNDDCDNNTRYIEIENICIRSYGVEVHSKVGFRCHLNSVAE